ncbi:DUF695 domain-containing protein [Sphingobacterium sp. WM]|uniref:DUF695 domain-containing protein n=1 Tax=Sphingobacterium TaxID=28453 RepID=UPI00240E6CCB|nr:DUF695 domain-containing protein [Sphingobacterium sp. WM]WFB62478.1 DUF695 domain-containing protein [Sphingobacterium sp. WM]
MSSKDTLFSAPTDQDYQAFWDWFQTRSQEFYDVIKSGKNVEEDFIQQFAPVLDKMEPRVFFLVGIDQDKDAELVFTPDGIIKNVIWAEKLVQSSPKLAGWKFRALKPESNNEDFAIRMHDLQFDKSNIKFYPILHANYPDKIDLMFVYDSYHEESREEILSGIFIFLDNYLGEETMIQIIDKIDVRGPQNLQEELIQADKLLDYLHWREKEFVEKYQDVRHNSDDDRFSGFEGCLENGKPILSTINTSVLNWDYKASHPWILVVMNAYHSDSESGFPNPDTYDHIAEFEEELEKTLPSAEGYIFLGSETVDGLRETFIACREFRNVSMVMEKLIPKYQDRLELSYDFYKDKYWQTFERYRIV